MSKDLVKSEATETAVGFVIDGIKFSDEEISGGMDTANGGYLSQYPLFIKASQNQFEVYDQRLPKGSPAVATLDKLTCIALYAHPSYRLTRGEMAGVDRSAWNDDDKKTVCVSYGTPWGKHQKSEGNFKGHLRTWLTDKERRAGLAKRLYVFVAGHVIPGYTKKDIAVLSLGGTGLVEWSNYNDALTKSGIPVSFIQTEIKLVPAKTDKGASYFRPQFAPVCDESGAPVYSTKATDAAGAKKLWLDHVVPMVDSVKAAHRAAMAELESQEPFAVADEAKAAVYTPAAFDDEEIAF